VLDERLGVAVVQSHCAGQYLSIHHPDVEGAYVIGGQGLVAEVESAGVEVLPTPEPLDSTDNSTGEHHKHHMVMSTMCFS